MALQYPSNLPKFRAAPRKFGAVYVIAPLLASVRLGIRRFGFITLHI